MNGKLAELFRNWWFMVIAVASMGAWGARLHTCVDNLSADVKELLRVERQIELDLKGFMAKTDTWVESHKEVHRED